MNSVVLISSKGILASDLGDHILEIPAGVLSNKQQWRSEVSRHYQEHFFFFFLVALNLSCLVEVAELHHIWFWLGSLYTDFTYFLRCLLGTKLKMDCHSQHRYVTYYHRLALSCVSPVQTVKREMGVKCKDVLTIALWGYTLDQHHTGLRQVEVGWK